MNYYFNEGFTYIEVGDGDELWENNRFEDIREAYSNIFWKMGEFYKKNRLYLIWGNHNRKWKNNKNVKKYLYQYYNDRKGRNEPLFDGIEIHEGLILRHTSKNKKIFIAHGHQGDLWNDGLWWLGRFVVRHIWKPFQILGVKDPTEPSEEF